MATQLDPGSLVIPDMPSEWQLLPPELVAALRPQVLDRFTDQWGKVHYFHPVVCYTPEQQQQINRILAGRWFLLKAHGRVKCGRCKGYHPYWTWGCIERPFNGLTEIIGLLRQRTNRDVEFRGMALGDIEPITAEKARELMDAMAAKGYPL